MSTRPIWQAIPSSLSLAAPFSSNSLTIGAHVAEVFYSLIQTCKLHRIEPYGYLKTGLTKIPALNTLEQLETLLPFNIQL